MWLLKISRHGIPWIDYIKSGCEWFINVTLSTTFRPHFYGFNTFFRAKVSEGKNCAKHPDIQLSFDVHDSSFVVLQWTVKDTLRITDNTNNTWECIATMSALSSLKENLTGTKSFITRRTCLLRFIWPFCSCSTQLFICVPPSLTSYVLVSTFFCLLHY